MHHRYPFQRANVNCLEHWGWDCRWKGQEKEVSLNSPSANAWNIKAYCTFQPLLAFSSTIWSQSFLLLLITVVAPTPDGHLCQILSPSLAKQHPWLSEFLSCKWLETGRSRYGWEAEGNEREHFVPRGAGQALIFAYIRNPPLAGSCKHLAGTSSCCVLTGDFSVHHSSRRKPNGADK